MSDPRRELYLSNEIDRLQDEKLEALKESRPLSGQAKADMLEKFLQLNKEQEKLENELSKLENDF